MAPLLRDIHRHVLEVLRQLKLHKISFSITHNKNNSSRVTVKGRKSGVPRTHVIEEEGSQASK